MYNLKQFKFKFNSKLSDIVNKKVMENLSKQNDVLIPIIKERELNFKSFVIGFHEYRKNMGT